MDTGNDIAIKVDSVSKTFKLPHEKRTSIKSMFTTMFRKTQYEKQQVLQGISFEVKKGEFFGIVGRNGSGKSTLLKMMAGIYPYSRGSITIEGKLIAFIELGVGFNPDLTGRENVYLNGALFGFNRKEVDAMYEEIVSFAELERFMDQKLKNYSSGMQVRLAFSIAVRARSDILLLDEVLAVGDSAFQQKCFDYFTSLKIDKKTIVLVSHNMEIVERFCDRALLLEKGKIVHLGSSSIIGDMYENMFLREEAERIREERSQSISKNSQDSVKIISTEVLSNNKKVEEIAAEDDFDIKIVVESKLDIDKVNIGLNVKNQDRLMLIQTDTRVMVGDIKLIKGVATTVIFKIQNILANGVYTVNIGVADDTGLVPKVLLRVEKAQSFTVRGVIVHNKSLAHPKIDVSIN